jgi:hypothetical protein
MAYHNSSWFTPVRDHEILRVAKEILSQRQANTASLQSFTVKRKKPGEQQEEVIEIYQGSQKVFEVDKYETRISVKGGWRHELKQELRDLNPEAILA